MGLLGGKDEFLLNPPNLPPSWNTTPSVTFPAGVADTYNLDQHTSDPEDDSLSYSLGTGSSGLPSGVTISGNQLVADGTQIEGVSSGIILAVSDGTNSPVDSSPFSITVDASLAEGTVNVFVDPDNGNDSYNGLYGSFQGGSDGPKATWSGVDALTLSNYDAIWFLQGTALTGERVDVTTSFVGTSGNYKIIGAYHLSGGSPIEGIGVGGSRPIIQGTTTRPIDYDATENLTAAQHFPSFVEGQFPSFLGAIDLSMQPAGNPLRKNTALDRYVLVKDLMVRHFGCIGISVDGGKNVTIRNCVVDCVIQQGINIQRSHSCIVEDCYMTACGYLDEYYGISPGPAGIFSNQSDQTIFRRNFAWLNYNEAIDIGNDSDDCLVEDCVSFDTNRLHYYCSRSDRAVFRRNLCFQTNRVSVVFGHDFSGQSEAFQQFGLMAAELQHTAETRWKNGVFYSNVIIYGASNFRIGDQYRQVNGATQHDFESLYIFNNTMIHPNIEIYTDSGGADPTASDGRYQYNLHIYPNNGTHNIRLVSWSNSDQKHNGWEGTRDSATDGWTNNVTITDSDHGCDTTGWDDLQSLGTWDLHNGHGMSLENAEALVAAVKAKLGGATGASADVSVDAPPGHPAEIIIASYDGLDFFGNPFVTNDIGAIRAS